MSDVRCPGVGGVGTGHRDQLKCCWSLQILRSAPVSVGPVPVIRILPVNDIMAHQSRHHEQGFIPQLRKLSKTPVASWRLYRPE